MIKKYVNYDSACRWVDRILADEDKIQDVEKAVLLSVKSMLNRLSEEVDICNHGKWKWNDHNGYYYCSECNAASPREDQEGEYCDTPMYCHNCGARMDLI